MAEYFQHFILADTQFEWHPVWQISALVAVVACCVLVWVGFRSLWGRASVDSMLGFTLIRTLAIAITFVILLGPTLVDVQPGIQQRSDLIYLLDGSSSMQLGQDESRWDEAVSFVTSAHESLPQGMLTDVSGYRFGHRLLPVEAEVQEAAHGNSDPADEDAQASGKQAANGGRGNQRLEVGLLDLTRIKVPDSSDSRLADGLRQLLPRINTNETEGIVLVSDGRIRSTDAVESLAEFYKESGVPIHVIPVGQSTGTGDIAIVSLVVEPTARKYTENELKIFFRSFGFNGQRTVVRLQTENPTTGEEQTISSIPVTLSGGAQSASLTFRIEAQQLDLKVVIDPIEGELATTNNEVATSVAVDRSKIRVLYVEGDPQPATLNSLARAQLNLEGAGTVNLPSALAADEDIECIMLYAQGRSIVRLGSTSSSSLSTFPKNRAELFSFDCVVFSNCSLDLIDEKAQENLQQWVSGRGGSLVLVGSQAVRADSWSSNSSKSLTPFVLDSMRFELEREQSMVIDETQHPIWQLSRETRTNDRILVGFPNLMSGLSVAMVKPTASVLASDSEGTPIIATLSQGRGRVLASAAGLAGRAMQDLGTNWGASGNETTGRFWRNVIYWATEGSAVGRRRLVVATDKQFYRPGDRLEVTAAAYDEGANLTQDYRVYAMLEPASLDDMSIYSSVLWPENIVRDSGEVGPRIAWGEELLLPTQPFTKEYYIELDISESGFSGDQGMRIELTAYQGEETTSSFGHGTQVDSNSLAIQILSDPFEQQNPLPNHEFLEQVALVSGGKVLRNPRDLRELIADREVTAMEPERDYAPAWSRWWIWATLAGLLSAEWLWRRLSGYA